MKGILNSMLSGLARSMRNSPDTRAREQHWQRFHERMESMQKTFPSMKWWGMAGAMRDYNKYYRDGIEERIAQWEWEGEMEDYWGPGMFEKMMQEKDYQE